VAVLGGSIVLGSLVGSVVELPVFDAEDLLVGVGVAVAGAAAAASPRPDAPGDGS
jgi:uncharacterized membrane protein YadS